MRTLDPDFCDDYYRLIFENSLDAILLTHPNGHVCRANPAACQALQRTEEEIVKAGRNGLCDTEDPRLEPAIQKRAEEGKASTELTFIRKDGTKFPVYLTSALFKDQEGNTWTVIIFRDISRDKQAQQALNDLHERTVQLAAYDDLTGVLNRRGFFDAIRKEMERSRRNGLRMGLLMIDIDRFKQINDLYGHLAGDKLLKKFADAAASQIRAYDILGRYGGDEFSICLPDTDQETALAIAERIRSHVESMSIKLNGHTIRITCSIGTAIFRPDSQDSIDTLISRVDTCMYMAKVRRNYVCGPE